MYPSLCLYSSYKELLTGPSICKSHACFSLPRLYFLSLSCLDVTKSSCNMHRLKFQLWCVAFPSFPGCSGFFLLGNPEYFLGDSPLTILCSDHMCLCSGSNLNCFEDRDNTRFTVLLPETSMALGMCFINMDLMRKMSCFSLNTSSSKSEKFSAGEIVGNYSFLAVNLTDRFPPISSLDQIKLTKCWI